MVDAPWASRLQDLADFTTPMTIRVAASLRLADHIAAGIYNLADLAQVTETDAASLQRVMRHLVAVGVFHETTPDSYELADLGKELCDQGPGDARGWLDLNTAVGKADLALVTLLDVVRAGHPVDTVNTWISLDEDPALSDTFDDQMASGAARKGPAFAAGYDWSEVNSFTDIGGGNGTLISILLAEHPHLHATLVDRELTAASAERRFAELGLTERTTISAQSFFDPLPTGSDIYVICGVLHDWPDADALKIMTRAAEAAGKGGTVLVLESLVDPNEPVSSTTDMDLLMLVTTGGRARPLADLAALAEQAGLRLVSDRLLAAPHSLVEFAVA